MIKRIDESEFVKIFDDYNRGSHFSVSARRILFEYYEEIDAEMELDVIAICCDWGEYDSQELIDEYGDEYLEYEDEDEQIRHVLEELRDETTVLETSAGTYLVLSY